MSVVLSEHLPLLASAPDGIQKLRGLILELAVRGKLVPQDPNDEPASELLQRIAKERARLEAEGICKKFKAMPLVGEDEQPFALPDSWVWVRVGSLGETQTGTTPSKSQPSLFGSDVPFIKPGDISDQGINYENEGLSSEGVASSGRLAQSGSVLMVCIGTIGKCGVIDRGCSFNQQINSVTPVAGTSPFVFAAMRSRYFQSEAWSRSSSTTIAILNKGNWEAIPLPLPPLAEQHRIVAKVDELMALCDRLEAEQTDAEASHARLVETLLDTLTQSADAAELAANWQRLAEHFGTLFTTESSLDALKQTILQLAVMGKLVPQDPNDEPASELLKRIAKERARLEAEGVCKKSKPVPPVGEDERRFAPPSGWAWCRLQNAYDVRDGTHDSPKFLTRGVPFLTSKNIYGGKLDLCDLKYISESDHIEFSRRSKVDRLDILFAMIGSIGNPVIVDTDLEFSFKNMALFKYFSKELSSPEYLRTFLSVISGEMKAKAAGGVQSFVALGTIRNQPMALPPLAEQHRIVAKVDELMALCDRLKADLAESRTRQSRLSATLIESALQAA